MASLRVGFAIAVFSTVSVLGGGCASTYPPNELPAPRDFSVDDMAIGGSGGNGGDDLAPTAMSSTEKSRGGGKSVVG